MGVWRVAYVSMMMLSLSSCQRDPTIKQVSVYTGDTSTTDTTPVRTELYNYIDRDKFKTDGRPPLTFVLPAAYYADGLSIKGGPVSTVSMEIDTKDWGPWALSPAFTANMLSGRFDRAAFRNRRILVSVSSNYSEIRSGTRSLTIEQYRSNIVSTDWLRLVLFNKVGSCSKVSTSRSVVNIQGIEIGSKCYYGVRPAGRKGPIEFIDCRSVCQFSFYFYGRTVGVIAQADPLTFPDLARQVKAFLERTRLKNNTGVPPPKYEEFDLSAKATGRSG